MLCLRRPPTGAGGLLEQLLPQTLAKDVTSALKFFGADACGAWLPVQKSHSSSSGEVRSAASRRPAFKAVRRGSGNFVGAAKLRLMPRGLPGNLVSTGNTALRSVPLRGCWAAALRQHFHAMRLQLAQAQHAARRPALPGGRGPAPALCCCRHGWSATRTHFVAVRQFECWPGTAACWAERHWHGGTGDVLLRPGGGETPVTDGSVSPSCIVGRPPSAGRRGTWQSRACRRGLMVSTHGRLSVLDWLGQPAIFFRGRHPWPHANTFVCLERPACGPASSICPVGAWQGNLLV